MSIQTAQPLLVLDTNVCLDLFVFHDPRWSTLLDALQRGTLKTITNRGCREEWLAVLQYSHLPITDETRPDAIHAFDQLITCIDPVSLANIKLPICSDPDDQQFMELARDGKATHLITKDKALLKCARKLAGSGLFQILQPEAFLKGFR
ncbi:putative PIN family toxin of toxin-antitoxin system [Oxalobacteraceae bacterium GrIS 2.11]